MNMDALLKLFAAAALLAGCAAPPGGGRREAEALSLWRDGAPAKSALLEYVAAATEEGSPDGIPPEERIAVFDFDGTLFCETAPTCFDWMLFDHRVLEDPSCRATDEQKAIAREAGATGNWPGLSHPKRERLMAEVWSGVAPEELVAYVRDFAEGQQPGFEGVKRKPLAFMLLCDDTVREFGNSAKAERMRLACGANGWIPVSMCDDWTTIYGPGVAKRPHAAAE